MRVHDVTHSVMFHHFHGAGHPVSQGSLSSAEFDEMLSWLSDRYNLLDANDYMEKAIDGRLGSSDVCLSFDDALLCQYDVAVPVMARRGLKAFFFIYSSPLEGRPDLLEVFRYFRTINYRDVGEFYEEFFRNVEQDDRFDYHGLLQNFSSMNYLSAFPFYTDADRWFRYLRDVVLKKQHYEALMISMMQGAGFEIGEVKEKLWMSNDAVKRLAGDGHVVGLHSDTHPTTMHTLTAEDQRLEYSRNKEHLSGLLGEGAISTMSHPCGNYNDATLSILSELGIRVGFRSSMSQKHINSLLEIPREDHANVFKEMTK